jgi:hypothetical protein
MPRQATFSANSPKSRGYARQIDIEEAHRGQGPRAPDAQRSFSEQPVKGLPTIAHHVHVIDYAHGRLFRMLAHGDVQHGRTAFRSISAKKRTRRFTSQQKFCVHAGAGAGVGQHLGQIG